VRLSVSKLTFVLSTTIVVLIALTVDTSALFVSALLSAFAAIALAIVFSLLKPLPIDASIVSISLSAAVIRSVRPPASSCVVACEIWLCISAISVSA